MESRSLIFLLLCFVYAQLALSSDLSHAELSVQLYLNGGVPSKSGEVVYTGRLRRFGEGERASFRRELELLKRSAAIFFQLDSAHLISNSEVAFLAHRLSLYDEQHHAVELEEHVSHGASLFLIKPTDHWIWPVQGVGEPLALLRPEPASGDEPLQLVPLSVAPRLFRIDNFVSKDEADTLVRIAMARIAQAHVTSHVHPDGTRHAGAPRISLKRDNMATVEDHDNAVVRRVNLRIAELVAIPLSAGLDEPLEIRLYEAGQHSHCRHDYKEPALFPNDAAVQNGTQRVATVFMFLSQPPPGAGGVVFCSLGDTPLDEGTIVTPRACRSGFTVAPAFGRALLWYNLDAEGHMSGRVDPSAMHAHCDLPSGGSKWGAYKHIKNKRFDETVLENARLLSTVAGLDDHLLDRLMDDLL